MRRAKRRSYLFNWDGSDCLALIKERPSEDDLLRQVFEPLEDSGVDTLVYMQGVGNFAEYRSKLLPLAGEARDYRFNSVSSYKRYANAKHFLDNGMDPLAIVVRGARERKLDVFFSFRLNDIHDHWPDCVDFLPRFKLEHPEWLHPKEYFPDFHGRTEITTALDYSVKEVRDFRLRIIREVLENYEFDGLELDFMRSPFYFHWDKGLGSAYMLTDFVSAVRDMLDEIGGRRGAYLELAVRVCTTVTGSGMAGFDVAAWAKRGYIDHVIAGTGGLNIDTRGYMELLQGTGVSFYPCLYGDYERIASSDAVMRGTAELLLTDRPDGIYAFNIYPSGPHRRELVRQIGNLSALQGLDKTYIVDLDYDYILTREEWRYSIHLPITLGETERESLTIPVRAGEELASRTVPEHAAIRLKVWIKDMTADDVIRFRWNGGRLEEAGTEPVAEQFAQHWLTWELRPSMIRYVNELSIQLVERNKHLKSYAPAIVQRVNLELAYH
ncbi:hypothetical protein [Paenibacillus chungangensis]|uniref:Glycosyl hydrolase-like 10 domain-containing protein n=1 Tax=Paenibacillus chungangensis TaxID=696535 RepID=A0ABW3HTM3_9BACL